MSHPNPHPRLRLCSALAGASLFTAAALAQVVASVTGVTNDLPGLVATVEPGETVGHEQVFRERLRSGTNEFVFVVPEGTRTEAGPDGQIVLSSWEQRFYLSIRLLKLPPSTPRLQEMVQQRIASDYPRATNVELFDTTVADQHSTGFQLRCGQAGTGTQFVRSVCVPFPAGLLQVTLNADARSARAGQRALDLLLVTFRSNQGGKLEVLRHSDRT